MNSEYDDSYMLCKVLEMIALQALELKQKINSGKELPSWAEYKVYKAKDAIQSALGSTYRLEDHMSAGMPMRIAMHKIAGEKDAPNYRPADGDKNCGNCEYRDESGLCRAFNFKCKADWVCDSWEAIE